MTAQDLHRTLRDLCTRTLLLLAIVAVLFVI